MQLLGIASGIQKHGLFIGERQGIVNFALSNIASPYKELQLDGREYSIDEFAGELAEFKGKKLKMICFGGGEPLLQIAYYKELLESLPLPLYVQTNGTMLDALSEVREYASMIGLQYVPEFQKEFIDAFTLIRNDDCYLRFVLDKEYGPKDVEDFAKIVASINAEKTLILEPVFGVKNYLSAQAMALRHLGDVRVIPRMHIA